MWDWLVTFMLFYRNRMRGLVAFRYEYVLFEDWLHLDMMCHSEIGQIRVCVVRSLVAFVGGFQSCIVRGLVVRVPYEFGDIRVCVIVSAVKSKQIRNRFCLIMGLGGVLFNQKIRVSKIS